MGESAEPTTETRVWLVEDNEAFRHTVKRVVDELDGMSCEEWVELDILSSTTNYIVRGLASATQYDFQVRAWNGEEGASVWSPTKADTTGS